ncbi:SRPBCC domain-containing protein [Mesorhizobium sp. DCY119]|uniref:SRPBCC family protein n=1 Tax=Mesorhizobium sp. DCY119 TaxID=2108445 RepID=UPI000E6B56E8|nr:SRPBCC domain-containing protein [Mesorhizobium sp. DCY119]RJG44928.1 SRPBCC domain-containing protein [Mesorhizobium sp. DCY119]
MSKDRAQDHEEIVVECTLAEAPEKVWRALTVPELLSAWLLPNDIRPEEGARFSFEGGPGEGGKVSCEVLDIEPHRHIRYSWRDGEAEREGLASTVSFDLTRTEAGGTHLRIAHEARVVALPAVRPQTIAAANSNRPTRMLLAA